MSASPRLSLRLAAWMVVGALGALNPAVGLAQYDDEGCGPFCEAYDYQFFEPVDLDLNCQPVRYDCGWTFSYDKLYWSLTGERTTVGDPTVDVISEVIFPGNNPTAENAAQAIPNFLLPDGTVPQAPAGYTVINGIRNAPPQAEFGWGDRYEMGYRGQDGTGFTIGVLDGPEVTGESIYGFAPVTDTQSSPFGFGSVHVNFSAPTGYLLGWRDYGVEQVFRASDTDLSDDDDDDSATGGVGPTQNGPGDGQLADGVIDDIQFNSDTFFIIDVNGDGVFDLVNDVFYIDFGDLHEFNIRFNQLGVRNSSQLDGVEIMRTVVLSNRHWMQKHQNQHLEIAYGARFLRLKDQFLIDGISDVLGRTFIDTQASNQIVGPQFRLKWALQKAKWNFSLDGRCMLGYNVGDLGQEYGIGESLAPGALNKPLLAQPTYGTSGRQENTFSPVAEFRAELKYLVTRSLSVGLGYNAMFIDNISRSSQLVGYNLPDPVLLDGGQQDAFVNGLNMKIEFWH